MKSPQRFYVYILFDWNGIPFYVGKGKGNRWLDHERKSYLRNPTKDEIIKRTLIRLDEIPKIKVRENITEAEAFGTEIALIAAIGRLDLGKGSLTNISNGGEGTTGHIVSDDARRRLRELNLGKRYSEASREKRRIAGLNRIQSIETKGKISRALRGLKRTPESRVKISNAAKKRSPPSEETKIKISASVRLAYQEGRHELTIPNHLGRKRSPETRAKQSALHKRPFLGRKHSQETIAKMRESGKKAWIKRRAQLV